MVLLRRPRRNVLIGSGATADFSGRNKKCVYLLNHEDARRAMSRRSSPCLAAAAVAFANPFKSKIISSDDSVLEITVPGDHFMKITNFTQDGGTDRAVVEVVLPGDTENGGTTNVLTATRIDFSTGSNAQNSPEIGNRVTIAGPAIVRIRPVVGAKLFITYKKERDEGSGGGGGGGGGSPTPIPIFSPTPTTATPTALRSSLSHHASLSLSAGAGLPSTRQSPSILPASI